MKILTVDVGGNHVKILLSGETRPRRFVSGPTLTPRAMVKGVKRLASGGKGAAAWKYDVVSLGYPGPVGHNQPTVEPVNLAAGWVKFDFEKAFGCRVRVVNDAAMQALGTYKGGKMLFLGLGTGLGSTMIVEGRLVPMELGHLPYRKATFEHYVGEEGLKRMGRRKWEGYTNDVVARLIAALLPEDVVLGGGNSRLLKELPPGCRLGNNANAFAGGFMLWNQRSKLNLQDYP
jgi:polyphosphate glucokinase